MQEEEWIQRSVRIRLYHELTHFICRKFWPEKKDALRDEIYADCIGLVAAFDDYDTYLAKLFLGIDKEQYRKGGRLEHYAPECTEEDIRIAMQWIEEAEGRTAAAWQQSRWKSLAETERNKAIFDLIGKIYCQ